MEKQLNRSFLLAVNFSPQQMQQDGLPDKIEMALAVSNRDPRCLELEITENALIGNSSKTREILNQIRALGLGIAIDGFGSGFSSLAYITRFRVDRIKIDRLFVQNSVTDKTSETVTRVWKRTYVCRVLLQCPPESFQRLAYKREFEAESFGLVF